MARPKIDIEEMNKTANSRQKASEMMDDKKDTSAKKKDFILLNLKPNGYDLKAYVNKRAGILSAERDKKVSATAFIQELIINDMNENQGKERKLTKREKIMLNLEKLDDKKLSALATILDIQII